MPLHPTVYAGLLAKKIRRHSSNVWHVNTGWTGGMDGVGSRMKLLHTRRLISEAIAGKNMGRQKAKELARMFTSNFKSRLFPGRN